MIILLKQIVAGFEIDDQIREPCGFLFERHRRKGFSNPGNRDSYGMYRLKLTRLN
jgi:hypothetical protein